jgi:hypothetical protein
VRVVVAVAKTKHLLGLEGTDVSAASSSGSASNRGPRSRAGKARMLKSDLALVPYENDRHEPETFWFKERVKVRE